MRRLTVFVCLALCVGMLVGCKQDPPRTVGNVASSRFRTFWGPVRSDRRHPTMAQRTQGTDGKMIPVELSNLGPILSQPIDISRDGTYRLRAGPIDISQFDPDVFGIQPPTDVAQTIRITSALTLDGNFVTFTVDVRGLHQPYPGFQVWVY